ncbi:MAG: helix-turn-helix domain-containing protein [Thermonemataceae bacterium]
MRGYLQQEQLAEMLGTKGPAIGRYERDVMKPSIEVATRMADILEVSLDYLVGKVDKAIDQETFKRLQDIEKLSEKEKEYVFALMDAFLRDTQTKKVYS